METKQCERADPCRRHHHDPCCGRHWGLWLLGGIIAGLYLLGKRQRPTLRFTKEEDIVTRPEEVSAWTTVTGLPQFYLMRRLIVQRALQGQLSARVLDIGCGPGRLTMLMAQQPQVKEAIGIDLSDAQVRQARRTAEEGNIDVHFMQVDGAEMPFADASFDVVVSAISLHRWRNPRQVLSEIQRVLTPGGQAFIFDLRRDAPPIPYGMATLVAHFIVPRPLRAKCEPLSSLQASYTPAEAALLAYKAGWANPHVTNGLVWLMLELHKEA